MDVAFYLFFLADVSFMMRLSTLLSPISFKARQKFIRLQKTVMKIPTVFALRYELIALF